MRRVGDRLYESDMGEVRVGPRETVAEIELTTVDVGNPHAVVLGDPADLPVVGPLLETHPRFPNRTNVQIARVDAPGEVTARVWERGVGETTASGSSAVAVAAATHGEGEVLVHFPGGDLRVRLRDGRATLIGPGWSRAERQLELRADLELAQHVVERRLQVGLRVALADDQRAADLERAGGELLRARAGHDDGVRRHVAAVLDRLGAGHVDHRDRCR